MAGRLASKVVVVTGGGTGIGRAAARRVVAEGEAVVLAGRRQEAGEQAAAELRGGGQALFVAADVTVESDAERLVRSAIGEFGKLDGAFSNAGSVTATGPVQGVGEASWHADLQQNLTSVFYSLKYQIPAMLESGGGSIVNSASIGGVRGIPGLSAYVAAKHGVVGLTRSAACWAQHTREHATGENHGS